MDFLNEGGILIRTYFTLPVLIGLERVRRSNKQSEVASRQISHLTKPIRIAKRSRTLGIDT